MATKVIPWIYSPPSSDEFEAWECKDLNGNVACLIVREVPEEGFSIYMDIFCNKQNEIQNPYDNLGEAQAVGERVLLKNNYILLSKNVKAIL